MKRTTGALGRFRGLLVLLAGVRRRPAHGDGASAREVLNQPPRPLRAADDTGPPTPHW